MDKVADPAPAFASTTSVPAFWILTVKAAASSSVNDTGGHVCKYKCKHVERKREKLKNQSESLGRGNSDT
jgi:hypothetical protein